MKNSVLLLLLVLFVFSCKEEEKEAPISEAYKTELEIYRTDKNQSRKDGYLQLCGLFKLDVANTFGKDSTNNFILSAENIAPNIGVILMNKNPVLFAANIKAEVRNEKDSIITNLSLYLDENGNSEKLFHSSLRWHVITRSDNLYLRVWDSENPAIDAFKGFRHYPINLNLILEGDFEYFGAAKEASVKSQLGVNANTKFIGKVTFDLNGETHDLEVGQDGFLMIADDTTGEATYGGGRYVYLNLPEKNGKVTIDFNKLYNPPCSFSDYTTCLYPPQGNYLPFEVNAGEQIATN